MSLFDTYCMVDWSGGNDTGPRPRKEAIWACIERGGDVQEPVYLRGNIETAGMRRTISTEWESVMQVWFEN